MAASSTPFSPLYEPGAPPPPLPLLTAQTDLKNPLRSSTLTNAEILPKRAVESQTTRRHTKVMLSHPSPSPGSDSPPGSDTSGSDLSEISESDSADLDDAKIPKPAGEAGRPGRGGYNLEVTLDWNPKAFKKLKVRSLIVSNLISDEMIH